jgi:hypothetical protein
MSKTTKEVTYIPASRLHINDDNVYVRVVFPDAMDNDETFLPATIIGFTAVVVLVKVATNIDIFVPRRCVYKRARKNSTPTTIKEVSNDKDAA